MRTSTSTRRQLGFGPERRLCVRIESTIWWSLIRDVRLPVRVHEATDRLWRRPLSRLCWRVELSPLHPRSLIQTSRFRRAWWA